jgi:hypothetical protein
MHGVYDIKLLHRKAHSNDSHYKSVIIHTHSTRPTSRILIGSFVLPVVCQCILYKIERRKILRFLFVRGFAVFLPLGGLGVDDKQNSIHV